MPSLGFTELVLILVIALVIFGPGKLPSVGRAIGSAMREFKTAKEGLINDISTGIEKEDKKEIEAKAKVKENIQ